MNICREKFLYSGLLVLLVVIIGIGADLMFMGASWWPFHKQKTPKITTINSLRGLYNCISMFYEQKNAYPLSIYAIKSFLGLSGDTDQRKEYFTDAWGHPIRYVLKNPKINPGKFDLYSVGPNGIDEYDSIDFGDDIHLLPDGGVAQPREWMKRMKMSGQLVGAERERQ